MKPRLEEILMKPLLFFATLICAASTTVHGQTAAAADTAPPQAATSVPASLPLTEGEVRKVDTEAAKLTLRHGPIVNLDMPAMTMVFRVSDPAFLDAVKPGDKVLFTVEKVGGQLTVTRIEAAK